MTCGTVFTIVHFHCSLQMGPLSASVTLHWTGKACLIQTLQANWARTVTKKMKCCEYDFWTVFTTVHLLCSLQMGQISAVLLYNSLERLPDSNTLANRVHM
jgi:hypothetical protein